jgi:hypothetical protein
MENFLILFNSTLSHSTKSNLIEYLQLHKNIENWLISSDYCLGDPNKPNDVFSFSIIPYFSTLSAIQTRINELCPKDIKKVKEIPDNWVKALASKVVFHFAFIVEKRRKWRFSESIENERPTIKILLEKLKNNIQEMTESQPNNCNHLLDTIKKIDALIIEITRPSSNITLLKDIMFASFSAAYLGGLISSILPIKNLAWLSDRDKISQSYNHIAEDFFYLNFLSLAKHFEVDKKPQLATTRPDETSEEMWFDEIIRIPDYFAGTLADWDIAKNQASKNKFLKIIEGAVADNPRFALIKIKYVDGDLQACRLRVTKNNVV